MQLEHKVFESYQRGDVCMVSIESEKVTHFDSITYPIGSSIFANAPSPAETSA